MDPNTPCCNMNCQIMSANSTECSEATECASAVMCKYPCCNFHL